MTSPPATLKAFTDAAAASVARVIAETKREAARERDLQAAEFRARLAELDAKIAAVAAAEQRLIDRLATVKDGEPGASVTVADLAPLVDEAVQIAISAAADMRGANGDKVIEALVSEEVRRAVAALPPPAAGKDADPEHVRAMVTEAVAALPPAQPGRDADPELIRAMVAEAVASLPPPEPGAPGRDADPEEIDRLITERAEAILGSWERPSDGKSVTVDDLMPVVAEAVQRAVDALPVPRDGEPGKDGVDGKLPIVRAWTDKVYYEGDVVSHDGGTWQANRDTGRAPPHEDWHCIAAPGVDGRTPVIRGTFDEGADYRALDVVMTGGASFVAKMDHPGPCPGEGWQLFAAQGKRGNPGETGRAIKGDVGPPGPKVSGMEVDGDGVLRLTNADGSVVSCDLYPLLSKL